MGIRGLNSVSELGTWTAAEQPTNTTQSSQTYRLTTMMAVTKIPEEDKAL